MMRYPIRAVVILSGSLVITCWALVACSGPQPLTRAIQPADESAYSQALADHDNNPGEAFLAMRAQQSGVSLKQATERDQMLSTTRNPFKARKDPVAVSRGAVVYKQHCADCHGQDADGRGTRFDEPLADADFHDFSHRFAVTLHNGAPRAWFRKITGGYTSKTPDSDGTFAQMPAFGDTLAREQVWLVITYLQSLDADIQDNDRAGNE
jgi:mono/diheme cytochrome c family protein